MATPLDTRIPPPVWTHDLFGEAYEDYRRRAPRWVVLPGRGRKEMP